MRRVREMLGDKFDAHVKRGEATHLFGIPCSELDREELLVALALAMDQYKFQVEGHEQTRRMHKLFDDARRGRA